MDLQVKCSVSFFASCHILVSEPTYRAGSHVCSVSNACLVTVAWIGGLCSVQPVRLFRGEFGNMLMERRDVDVAAARDPFICGTVLRRPLLL